MRRWRTCRNRLRRRQAKEALLAWGKRMAAELEINPPRYLSPAATLAFRARLSGD